ncbi:MAG: hypothetical protein EOP86_01370 [Verrucomicrobiaceae bacterium]|nr:MAG: hypothetical protein EOP86_01370 [Verrucomicrobiaceae bacterium]
MRFPYPLLISAAVLWLVSLWIAPRPVPPSTRAPVLGVAGSSYGSLLARLMRDPLFSYWHEGARAEDHHHEDEAIPHQAFPAALRKHLNLPEKAPINEVPPEGSWLERTSERLERLEASRTRRNSSFAVSASHRRYMNSAATWRLRLACHLDPGDMVLYEILHAQTSSGEARLALAEQVIGRALLPAAGFSEALTGAGAAVNLLNEALQPEKAAMLDPAAAGRWLNVLERCLLRYQHLRETAVREQWWEGIPEERRGELDTHAALLNRLSDNIHQHLAGKGVRR